MMNSTDILKLTNAMTGKAELLETLLIAVQEDENVTLTPKQVTDIVILIGELTIINTGFTVAQLEETEQMQSLSERIASLDKKV